MNALQFKVPKDPELRDTALARAAIGLHKLPAGKAWLIKVEELKPRRSENQNALMWVMYEEILKRGGEAMGGWTKADLHVFFLCRHFGEEIKELFGVKRRVPLRTSSGLNKQEMADYIQSIEVFAAQELGIALSMPGDSQ